MSERDQAAGRGCIIVAAIILVVMAVTGMSLSVIFSEKPEPTQADVVTTETIEFEISDMRIVPEWSLSQDQESDLKWLLEFPTTATLRVQMGDDTDFPMPPKFRTFTFPNPTSATIELEAK
jgi:hypothetical protein